MPLITISPKRQWIREREWVVPVSPFSPGGPGIPSRPWLPLIPTGPGDPGNPGRPKQAKPQVKTIAFGKKTHFISVASH